MDLLLTALKFTAIFVSGIAGVLALLVNYKDDAGRITPWGRRALVIVVTSAVLASGIQSIEFIRQRQAERATAQRNERLLAAVRRAALRFSRATLSLDVTVRLPPQFEPYSRLLLASALKMPRYAVDHSDVGGKKALYYRIGIEKGDKLYPQDLPIAMLLAVGVDVSVWAPPIGDRKEEGDSGKVDWKFSVFNDLSPSPPLEFRQRASGELEPIGPQLRWRYSGAASTETRTQRLMSISDFDGASIHLTPNRMRLQQGRSVVFLDDEDISFEFPVLYLDDYPIQLRETPSTTTGYTTFTVDTGLE